MIKKLFIIVILLSLVGCGAKKNSLSGKKVRTKELVSKDKYRAELRKKEEHDRKIAADKKQIEKEKSTKDKATKQTKSEVLVATSNVSVTTDMIQDYILQYKPIAQKSMKDHGIPASITLAQGVLESGSGQGTLSRNANNHFGIKCHQGWEGDSVRHTDDAPDECFRKYDKPEDSYRDHALFLVNRSRYSSLFDLDKDDYKSWARGLKKAGYATDPKYADKLISLIDRYSLYNYDAEVLGKKSKYVDNTSDVAKLTADTKSLGSMHVVQKGDTLYSISKKYNLTVEQVQKLNKINGTAISVGQVIKVK